MVLLALFPASANARFATHQENHDVNHVLLAVPMLGLRRVALHISYTATYEFRQVLLQATSLA